MAVEKIKVLFLCTGNSCRSQMAEGWARALVGDLIEPYSAGIEKHGLNPHAVAVMQEIGIEISAQQSKTLEELAEIELRSRARRLRSLHHQPRLVRKRTEYPRL